MVWLKGLPFARIPFGWLLAAAAQDRLRLAQDERTGRTEGGPKGEVPNGDGDA